MTADGKISTRNRTPSTFTSARDKERLLEIRSLGDAVLAGRTTIATDQMSMGLPNLVLQEERLSRGQSRFPLRVVVSRSGKISAKWKIFSSPGGRVLVFSGKALDKKTQGALPGEDLVTVHTGDNSSLPEVLHCLKRDYQVETLVCEGGPTLFRSLLEIGALDELYLTIAPRLFGGETAPTLTGQPGEFLPSSLRLQLHSLESQNGECFLHYLHKGSRRDKSSARKRHSTTGVVKQKVRKDP